jgi:hypothetical protein
MGSIIIDIDEAPVRFTPEGKVSVVDAIGAVAGSDDSPAIWENIKSEHPQILEHCDQHAFQGTRSVAVVDSEGWEKIWEILPYYIFPLDPDAETPPP